MIKSGDVCGLILAGGQSARMGSDKALLRIDGQPLLQRLSELLFELTDEVVVSANESSGYSFLGLPVVMDTFAGQGPLAGLHAAMHYSPRELFLVLACDMPAIRSVTLKKLIHQGECWDAVVPVTSDARVHPLCALYRRTCLPLIEHRLAAGENRVTAFVRDASLRVRWLDSTTGGFEDADLINLNSLNDLGDYLRSKEP